MKQLKGVKLEGELGYYASLCKSFDKPRPETVEGEVLRERNDGRHTREVVPASGGDNLEAKGEWQKPEIH